MTTVEGRTLKNALEVSVDRVSVRVSPHNYFTILLMGSFLSAFFFYLENDLAGVVLFVFSWVLVPFLALRDRIVFDGRRLRRTGFVPRVWAALNRSRNTLKYRDIEQVETHATRAVRRGGAVYYRYRTVVKGRGLEIAVSSGGDGYRKLLSKLLPLLNEDILDHRSVELRDHLRDPKELTSLAEEFKIPSSEVLEDTLKAVRTRHSSREVSVQRTASAGDVSQLSALANGLRLSGNFLQALEAFRRGLAQRPSDARLLFDFGRCLYTFASVRRDPRLERRALAALRRSESKARDDGELLVRVGEWYFQIGEIERAAIVLKRASSHLGESFRSARGMAELALREGKLAHVVHHFAAANRVTESAALKRWSKNETDYFASLSNDDEYLETEIARVRLLEKILAGRRSALRIAMLGFPAILYGVIAEDDLIANIGWAISMVALVVWSGLAIGVGMLSRRIPYRMFSEETK